MKRIALHVVLMLTVSSSMLFAIDNLKLNSKLDYTSDSLDGPLITGDDAQPGFVPGNPNYVIIYGEGCFNSKRQAQRTVELYNKYRAQIHFVVIDLDVPRSAEQQKLGRSGFQSHRECLQRVTCQVNLDIELPLSRARSIPPVRASQHRKGGRMKAVQLSGFAGLDSLKLVEIDRPTPSKDEVLIEVKAAGINFAELEMIRGRYPATRPLPFTMGFEASGIVADLGSRVTNLKVGDRIASIVSSGGYADYATADASIAIPIPHGVTFAEANAITIQGVCESCFWIGGCWQSIRSAFKQADHRQSGANTIV